MSFEKIQQWANKQPRWAQHALQELACTTEPATALQIQEGLVRLKHESGIIQDPAPEFAAFMLDQFSSAEADKKRTYLVSISEIKNLNRLAKDQILPFALSGITLIYGENGAGKSGYSRLTKHLCRTVSQEPLLKNVYEPVQEPIEALVTYLTEGDRGPTSVKWLHGAPPPAAITSLSVFDAANCVAYLDNDNKVIYRPQEILLLERFAEMAGSLGQLIQTEIEQTAARFRVALPTGFHESTEVHRVLQKITATPSRGQDLEPLPTPQELDAVSIWNVETQARHDQLEKELASDPITLAEKKRRSKEILTRLAARVSAAELELNLTAIRKIDETITAYNAARARSTAAATDLFNMDPLPKTGGDVWKQMFEHAKAYVAEIGGTGTCFDDKCALCQQNVEHEAKQRLDRFEAFIGNQINRQLIEAQTNLAAIQRTIDELVLPDTTTIEATLAGYCEIETDGTLLKDKAIAFFQAASAVRQELTVAISTYSVGQTYTEIQTLSEDMTLASQAIMIEDLADKDRLLAQRNQIKNELEGLKDQKKLSEEIDTFKARLADIEYLRKLDKCKQNAGTASASTLISTMGKTLLNADLQAAIKTEMARLGLTKIPFKVAQRSVKGDSVAGVKLETPTAVKTRSVLSEGEQKVLGLACFLAEAGRDPLKHGLILDDPVSSLDHKRMRNVARRLVDEAANERQIIIFTHNLNFFQALTAASAERGTELTTHHVTNHLAHGSGVINQGVVPWIAMSVKERIKALREHLSAYKDHPDPDSDQYKAEICQIYAGMREAWERCVEEILFYGTIHRFDPAVKTLKLAGASVSEEDYKTIYFAMTKASEFSGHDAALDRQPAIPEYDEVLADLQKLEDFSTQRLKAARQLEESRKADVKVKQGQLITAE